MKIQKGIRVLPILAIALLLAACGGTSEEPSVNDMTAVTPVEIDLENMTEEADDAETPSEMPEPGIPDPEAFMTQQARNTLADRLHLDVEDVSVINVEPREWPDAALGCPDPEQMYAQVLTPGYEIELSAAGETYTYHTDMEGRLVLCGDDGEPVEQTDVESEGNGAEVLEAVSPVVVDLGEITPQPPEKEERLREIPAPGIPDPSATAANKAAVAFAKALGIDVGDVEVVSIEPVEWPDSSLGCPRPGQAYLTVITPGFRIILDADGERAAYHADMQGNVVRCGSAGITPSVNQ